MTAEAFGYFGDFASGVEIVTDETTDQDFSLVLLPRFTVSGTITAAENGSPIAGAHVTAVGTPVPPATTDASGDYSLELPIGTYTAPRERQRLHRDRARPNRRLASRTRSSTRTSACSASSMTSVTQCTVICSTGSTRTGESALYGDEFAGRLRLPFEFPFYDGAYEQIYLSDNGYMNFLAPEQFNNFPQSHPIGEPAERPNQSTRCGRTCTSTTEARSTTS